MRPDAMSSSRPEASETDLISIFATSIAMSLSPPAAERRPPLSGPGGAPLGHGFGDDAAAFDHVGAVGTPGQRFERVGRVDDHQIGDAAGLGAIVGEPMVRAAAPVCMSKTVSISCGRLMCAAWLARNITSSGSPLPKG